MALTDSQSKDFVRLVTEHQAELFYYILSLVPHRADAEEILQDTHLFLWEHFTDFLPGSSFRAWAFQVAYHRVLKFFGRQERSRKVFSDQFLAHLSSLASEVRRDISAKQESLDECLKKLKSNDRALLEARYRPGGTVAEIAKTLNRNARAVYQSLHRIHRVLFECLQQKLAMEDEA